MRRNFEVNLFCSLCVTLLRFINFADYFFFLLELQLSNLYSLSLGFSLCYTFAIIKCNLHAFLILAWRPANHAIISIQNIFLLLLLLHSNHAIISILKSFLAATFAPFELAELCGKNGLRR